MQLSLPFQTSTKADLFKEEDFLPLTENSAAINFLKKFFEQKDFVSSQFQSLILKGAKDCGKTHLLHIFAKKFAAEFLDQEKIIGVNPADFFTAHQFYILENVAEITDEGLVLRLINSAVEAKAFLILSSRNAPQFSLKDLASRVKNIFSVEIKNPSQESLKLLLTNSFSRKQIKLSRAVIDFVSENIDRSYESLFAAVRLLEFHSQESAKALDLNAVKKILSKS